VTATPEARPDGYPATPTLDRMLAVQGQTQPAGQLLDWLEEQGWQIAMLDDYGQVRVSRPSIERLLAEWQGINLDAAERERRAVLDWVRSQNA
jgi:hypothetical protein